ncbi:TPM domain-containing protein [Sphingomonas crocodyli]|nr:TPM domain-containing protein [Sphingomonas crocodyli]
MRRTWMLSTASAALLLAGCDSKDAETAAQITGGDRVEAIASTLQACSYDGEPVNAAPASLNGNAPADCSMSVKRIMGFTGLPANFVVVSGPVPNAAAVIMLDQNRISRRVIAFNPNFMAMAQQTAKGSQWGPMSIMAHEIAHHLSGHTIVPGGSRPEIELEADKFSGFVLQKMGAPIDAATQMILAMGTNHGTPTHPDKQSRADAIRQGWNEAKAQGGGASPPAAQPAVTPPTAPPAVVVPAAATAPIVLPKPGSIPFKYGRFVVDETGKLDPARVKPMEDKLRALAKDAGVEMTFLVVNDLKGMSADDYAWAMMRQLRIGKLDVGNGAVVVVAPRQKQAAVAYGPGLAKEAEFSDPKKQLLSWIDNGWRYCDDADGCKTWTDSLFSVFNGTLFNAERTKWTIQYPTLGALMDHYKAVNDDRMKTKRPFDPKTDQPLGNLIRISGKITSLSPPTGIGQVNPKLIGGPLGYTAVSMTTDDGHDVILYVSPRLAPLMPSGKIKDGSRYTAVGRLNSTGDKASGQASSLWLFSYDEI